jgi:hypothetical protein
MLIEMHRIKVNEKAPFTAVIQFAAEEVTAAAH